MQRIHAALGRRHALATARSVCLVVPADDRARSEAIVADRDRPREHAARARLVLLSADRPDVATVARRAAVSRPAARRRQRRCAGAGRGWTATASRATGPGGPARRRRA